MCDPLCICTRKLIIRGCSCFPASRASHAKWPDKLGPHCAARRCRSRGACQRTRRDQFDADFYRPTRSCRETPSSTRSRCATREPIARLAASWSAGARAHGVRRRFGRRARRRHDLFGGRRPQLRRAENLKVDREPTARCASATAADYTHIRWHLKSLESRFGGVRAFSGAREVAAVKPRTLHGLNGHRL